MKIVKVLLRVCVFIYVFFFSVGSRQMVRQSMRNEICENQMKTMGYKLTPPLLHLCRDELDIFRSAVAGFERGIEQCKSTFKKDRWNCTTLPDVNQHELFGTVMARGSKEAAIMFAMASAGMVEWITAQLYKGKREKYKGTDNDCNQVRRPRHAREYVNSQDCDADVTRGDGFARRLIEKWTVTQKTGKKERLMNTHNAAVGRLAVRQHMEKVCRCVGLSGACNAKCCYKTLQPLKVSAEWLRVQYQKAQKVKPGLRPKRDGTGLLLTEHGAKTPHKTDLIYILDSPNYCHYDNATGSLGTKGRQCNATSMDSESCDSMCCARGHAKHEVTMNKYCNCRFNWCCEVNCDTCREKVIIHRCK